MSSNSLPGGYGVNPVTFGYQSGDESCYASPLIPALQHQPRNVVRQEPKQRSIDNTCRLAKQTFLLLASTFFLLAASVSSLVSIVTAAHTPSIKVVIPVAIALTSQYGFRKCSHAFVGDKDD